MHLPISIFCDGYIVECMNKYVSLSQVNLIQAVLNQFPMKIEDNKTFRFGIENHERAKSNICAKSEKHENKNKLN